MESAVDKRNKPCIAKNNVSRSSNGKQDIKTIKNKNKTQKRENEIITKNKLKDRNNILLNKQIKSDNCLEKQLKVNTTNVAPISTNKFKFLNENYIMKQSELESNNENEKLSYKRLISNTPYEGTIISKNLQKLLALHKSGNLQCSVCNKLFIRRHNLLSHVSEHVNDLPFQCKNCLSCFKNYMILWAHFKNNHSSSNVELNKRNKKNNSDNKENIPKTLKIKYGSSETGFKNKFDYKPKDIMKIYPETEVTRCTIYKGTRINTTLNNILKQHKYKTRHCLICKQLFSDRISLEKHFILHSKDFPFECKYCSMKFTKYCLLASHFKVQHSIKQSCQMPPSRPSPVSEFKRRDIIVLNDQNNKSEENADIINTSIYRGVQISLALKHILVSHNPQSGFNMCNICKKIFTHRNGLERHIIVHTDDKPFVCKVCHKSFSLYSQVTNHFRDYHFKR